MTYLYCFICSCMMSLRDPLLGLQFTDPDQQDKSFLCEFATEILVSKSHRKLWLDILLNFDYIITAFRRGSFISLIWFVCYVWSCFGLQAILSGIGESLPELLCHELLKKHEVPGFLEEEVRYPKESLANLAYLLFVHHIAMETFPVVLR